MSLESHRQPVRTARAADAGVRAGRCPTAETVAKINAVTLEDVRRAAVRVFRGAPTLTALGPVRHIPRLGEVADRLAA